MIVDVAGTVTAIGESTIAVGWSGPGSVDVSRPKRRLSSSGVSCCRLDLSRCLNGPCGMISRRKERKKECGVKEGKESERDGGNGEAGEVREKETRAKF